MEQKKLSLALLFSLLFSFIYLKLVYEPKYPVVKTEKVVTEQKVENKETTPTQNANQPATEVKINQIDLNKAELIKVVTEKYEAQFSLLGGRLVSYKLNNFKDNLKNNESINLIEKNITEFPLGISKQGQDDSLVQYSLATDAVILNKVIAVGSSQTITLDFQGNLNGESVNKKITILGNQIDFGLSIPKDYSVILTHKNSKHDDRYNPHYLSAISDKKRITQLENNIKWENQKVNWIGFGDKYFFKGVISPSELAETSIEQNNEDIKVLIKNQSSNYKVYFGAKNRSDLIKTGHDLNRVIDLGFFTIIAEPILNLLNMFYSLVGNYGLAIILVTLFIKLLLLPLTASSYKSMKAMQELQPEMNSLKERIKDQTVLQQEILKLYQKHNVNPLGGCLPMLIQLPIFFGLLSAFQNSLELRHANFAVWVKDLSAPEHLELFGIPFPLLTLLFAGSIYLQQLSMPANNMDPTQRKMMLFMPLIFIVMMFIYPVPSALILYYLVNNLITFVQQKLLKDGKSKSALKATVMASIGIFLVAFLMTLI